MNRSDSIRSRPAQDPHHRRFEVVVPDPAGHPAEVLERADVTLQERLLGLVAERHVKRPTRVGQPHHEHPAPSRPPRPASRGTRRSRPRPPPRADGSAGSPPRRRPAPTRRRRRATYRDTVTSASDGAVLGHQPLPHPPSGVTLLARRLPVRQQPAVDHRHPRIQRRPGPRRVLLARRRNRGLQRLPHRAPMHPMPLSQLPDRQLLQPPIPPDLLEQLHA